LSDFSVWDRDAIDTVDDEHVHWPFLLLELQAELLIERYG